MGKINDIQRETNISKNRDQNAGLSHISGDMTWYGYGGSTNTDWLAFYCTHVGKESKTQPIINGNGQLAINFKIRT